MTTPNVEELITYLQGLANEIEIPYPMEVIEEAAEVLQSQAERIDELERESETHAKAYGLAIVERDNLRHELKTAQEGWRCECSTDDACRFARERDALRAELAESISNHEACKSANTMLLDELATIAATEPYAYEFGNSLWHADNQRITTAEKMGKPLFTRPMPAQLSEMEARKDAAYLERNQLVSLLSKLFPSGIKRTAIEGWSDDWHGCVYIDLPTGQASWHYHDSQAYLFAHLPPYAGEWDGHDTEQKYERIANAMPAQDVTELVEALEKLARLGNGDHYGNSDGNMIARDALSKYKGAK